MKLVYCLLFIFTTTSLECAYALSFAHIPSAPTLEQGRTSFQERRLALLQDSADHPIAPFMERNPGAFYKPLLAKMLLGHDVSEANQLILDPAVKPYAHYGTDISIAGGLCKRVGDYDFMMIGLIQLLYHDKHGALSPEARRKIMHELISAKGQEHYETFSLGLCGRHKDTENHILMTEGTRYLVNQLLHDEDPLDPRWNNEAGGFDDWMLHHLQQFMLHHFDEYNSRPYQVYTNIAIANIAAHARHPKVKTAARMLLDYLDVIWSFQSNHGRRVVPFRRQPRFLKEPRLAIGDSEMARMMFLTGHYPYLFHGDAPGHVQYGDHMMLFSLLNNHQLAPPVEKFLFDFDQRHYFQVLHHQNVEIYASHPQYLISAGGRWHNRFDMATGENDGSPRPTTIILSQQNHHDERDFIRFAGHPRLHQRHNTCVLPDFACGLNLTLPPWLEEGAATCLQTEKGRRFYRLDHTCPVNLGVYVALVSEEVPRLWRWWYGRNFGLLEIRAAADIAYDQFKRKVSANKLKLSLFKPERYTTSRGEKIVFKYSLAKKNQWEISESSKSFHFDDFDKWPRAWGDILNDNAPGSFQVSFPGQKNIYHLNFSQTLNPVRQW